MLSLERGGIRPEMEQSGKIHGKYTPSVLRIPGNQLLVGTETKTGRN